MATYTPVGTVLPNPSQITSSSDPNMVSVITGYQDDSTINISIPFAFQFYNQLVYSWNVGSNSYITESPHSDYNPTSTMDAGVYVLAGDNSWNYVGTITSSDTKAFTIHFEGNNTYSNGANNLHWDVTFFIDGTIQLVTGDGGTFADSGNSFSCISNAVSDSSLLNFTPVASQSYVFTPNSDFSAYTMTSGSSYVISTTTSTNPPNLPTMTSPSDGASFTVSNVTFSGVVSQVDAVPTAIEVTLATDLAFSTGVTTVTSAYANSGSTATISRSMANGTWYWKARALSTNSMYSGYTSVKSFNVNFVNSPPGVPTNLSPADQYTATVSTPVFSASVTDPNGDYLHVELQLTQDPTFATLTTTLSSSSYASGSTVNLDSPSLSNGAYYWRVRGVDSLNAAGAWSDPRVIYISTPTHVIYSPDAFLEETNVTGAISLLQGDPNYPDGQWLSVTTAGTATTIRVSFPNPQGDLITGVGNQVIKYLVKETSTNSSTLTVTPYLYENGTLKVTGTSSTITSTTGTMITFSSWDAASLSDIKGTNVELRLVTTAYSKGGSKDNITFGSISWDSYQNGYVAPVTTPLPPGDTTPPANVSSLAASNTTATGVTLTWSNPSDTDFKQANVYRNSTLIGNSTNGSYADSGLIASNTYTYKVTSVDMTGNESSGTTIVVTTTANVPPSVPTNLFPFNGSAWTKLHFEADVTDADSTNLTFKVDYSSTSSTLSSGVTTVTQSITLPSAGQTVRASITPANTNTENTVFYWRAYVTDNAGNTSSQTSIFSFTIKNASGDNMVADGTPFMQQGDNYNFVRAIDVSSLQGTIDWVSVKNSGVNYALLRCYGVDHSGTGDTNFETYVTNAKAAGVKTGGYFYLNVVYPYNLNDAHTEADKFITKLQSGYGTGKYGDFMPFVDLEDNTGHVTAGQTNLDCTVEQFLQWVSEFRNYFETQTGRKLGAYIPDYFVRNQRNNFNHDDTINGPVSGTSGNIIKDMCLWASGFTSYPRYMGGVMPSFGGWHKWQAFQHGDTNLTPPPNWTLSGITGTVDLDWIIPQTEVIFPPNTPTGLSATDDGSNVYLMWTTTTESDVHKWDIYVDGSKVGTSLTDGSYTISGLVMNSNHTIEVRPIDDFGDKPVVPATLNYTLGTVTTNPPLVTIVSLSRTKISDEPGVNSSTVVFNFDKDVKAYSLNVNGADHNTGTIVTQGGGASETVADLQTQTVAQLATKTVGELVQSVIPARTNISVTVLDTEMYQEGDNRVNIYGQSAADNSWTPYDTN